MSAYGGVGDASLLAAGVDSRASLVTPSASTTKVGTELSPELDPSAERLGDDETSLVLESILLRQGLSELVTWRRSA